jgi:hypothetical protein
MRANVRFASSCSVSTAIAPAPAMPASTQPERTITIAGSRSSGSASIWISGAIASPY